ncbi:MAG TPA: alkaline phosphatase family protein [Thermoplasmata archaeon]|nr:alkaline phosphatase family protein [Thermoplasmata archaeon]
MGTPVLSQPRPVPGASAAPGALSPRPRDRPRISRRALAILVAILLVVSISVPIGLYELRGKRPVWGPGDIPIKHIVVLMMENHAFDSLFGTYCPSVGPNCPMAVNGIPYGTCVPRDVGNSSAGCVRPYSFTAANLTVPDMLHIYNATTGSIDHGRMDGFYQAENAGREPFGNYNGSLVPIAWDLAQRYALGDGFFSSALSYSLPNHWYLLAGQAPPVAINEGFTITTFHHTYLNEANKTKTVQDLLNVSPMVSWKYYDWALPSYQVAINGIPSGESAYNNWNPLAARAESYTSWYSSHFAPRSQFFNDSAAGALPDVSWVIPDIPYSDHPPANMTAGETFIANVVDAVEASPDWSSTALFLAWDDYGGFYDQVPPPTLDGLGLSVRVPLIVVSPYTPAGLVVHSLGYFESLLHFIEWRFNLGCITARDCNAPLPFAYFDFNGTARAPVMFPTNATNASYPMSAAQLALTPQTDWSALAAIPSTTWDSGPPNPNLTATEVD